MREDGGFGWRGIGLGDLEKRERERERKIEIDNSLLVTRGHSENGRWKIESDLVC